MARWVYRHRLALIFLGLLPIVSLGLLAYHVAASEVHSQVRAHQRTAALISATVVEQVLDRNRSLVKSLANLDTFQTDVVRRDEEEVREALRLIVESHQGIEKAYVADPAGFAWGAYPEMTDPLRRQIGHHDWFERTVARQQTVVSQVFEPTHVPEMLVVAVASPIRLSGADPPIGYLICMYAVDGFERWFERIHLRHHGELFILDQRGTIAAHSEPERIGETYPIVTIPILLGAHGGLPGTGRFDDPISGQVVLGSAIPVRIGPDKFWTIVAQQSVEQAEEPIREIANVLLITGSFIALAAIMVLGAMGRTQRWLLNTEQFVDSIVESIPDMVAVKDAKSLRYVRINVAGEKVLGMSRREILGRTDYDLLPKQQADAMAASDRKVIREQRAASASEQQVVTRLRGMRVLHTRKVPLWERPGRPDYLLCICEDITDRKSMERERDLLWNHSFDPSVVTDFEGRYLRVNPAFEQLIGFSHEDLLGQSAFRFIHPDDHEGSRFQLERLRYGQPVIDFQTRVVCHDGSIRWLSWRAFAHETKIYAMARDVTPFQRQLERCSINERALAEASREVEQIALLAAAALDEPAHDILERVERLEPSDQEDSQLALNETKHAATHLTRLLTTMRRYAQVTRGAGTLARLDLEALAKDVAREFESELTLSSSALFIGKLPSVIGDEAQIRLLLHTLLEHAFAFRVPDRPLHIEIVAMRSEDGFVEWTVRDTGLEFAKRYPQAFDAMAAIQLDATDVAPPAWGLELMLCRRIVKRHGGSLEIQETGPSGAAYRIRLRAAPDDDD